MRNAAYWKAREFFGMDEMPLSSLCLHHKDPALMYTDFKRYNEWRPEDLMVLTNSLHATLHHTFRNGADINYATEVCKRSFTKELKFACRHAIWLIRFGTEMAGNESYEYLKNRLIQWEVMPDEPN